MAGGGATAWLQTAASPRAHSPRAHQMLRTLRHGHALRAGGRPGGLHQASLRRRVLWVTSFYRNSQTTFLTTWWFPTRHQHKSARRVPGADTAAGRAPALQEWTGGRSARGGRARRSLPPGEPRAGSPRALLFRAGTLLSQRSPPRPSRDSGRRLLGERTGSPLRSVAPAGTSQRGPTLQSTGRRIACLLEMDLGELRFPRASWVPTQIHVPASAAGQPAAGVKAERAGPAVSPGSGPTRGDLGPAAACCLI